MRTFLSFLFCLFHLVVVSSQDYADFARENGLARRRNNRGTLVAGVVSGIIGGVVGGFWKSRSLKKKYDKDRKDLLKYMQLQEEIYKQRDAQWQAEYQKLYKAYNDLEKETTERDYEEFKAPDTNNDDMISQAEFNIYVRKYLSSFPELSEKDFPKFEEFDLNGDGQVTFEEWQQFLYQQKLKEAQAAKAGEKKSAYSDLLDALYQQTNQADSFNSLQKNSAEASRGKQRRIV